MPKLTSNSTTDGLTLRSIIIGLLLVVLFCLLIPYNDFYIEGTFLAGNHFPIGAMFLLILILFIINPLLNLLSTGKNEHRRNWMLSETELVTIWCMMLVSISIPTVGLARWLYPILVGFRYFATTENDWQTLFDGYFPDWLAPTDPQAIQYFYEKLPHGLPVPYWAWFKPILFWMGVIGGLWLLMITLSVIFRQQWIQREKYTFPLAQLPSELVKNPPAGVVFNVLLKKRLLWISISIPVFVHTCNGLNFYLPNFPAFPLKFNLNSYLTEKPWSAARPMWLFLFPSVIGFTYLVRLDVALSIWFFFLFYRLQLVIATAFGIPMEQSMGYTSKAYASHLEMGGYIVAVTYFIWAGRQHLAQILWSCLSRNRFDLNQPIAEPWLLPFLMIGILLPSSLLHSAGANFLLCIGVIGLMGISSIMLTYIVIAGGIIHINSSFRAFDFYYTAFGSNRISPNSLAILSVPSAIFRTKRGFLMPHISNAFKMATVSNLKGQQLLSAMMLALTLSVVLTSFFFLKLVYQQGALNLQYWTFMTAPLVPFRWLEVQFQSPSETDWINIGFVALGAVSMCWLYWIRNQFIWWPFHPIGFVASPGEFALNNLWFSICLGWMLKVFLLKFGGLKAFQRAKPFFIGLVVGDCLIGGIWAIVGLIVGEGYTMLPG